MDLALNNLQRLICHKTHQTKPTVCKQIIFIKQNFFVFDRNTWNHLTVSKQMINIK